MIQCGREAGIETLAMNRCCMAPYSCQTYLDCAVLGLGNLPVLSPLASSPGSCTEASSISLWWVWQGQISVLGALDAPKKVIPNKSWGWWWVHPGSFTRNSGPAPVGIKLRFTMEFGHIWPCLCVSLQDDLQRGKVCARQTQRIHPSHQGSETFPGVRAGAFEARRVPVKRELCIRERKSEQAVCNVGVGVGVMGQARDWLGHLTSPWACQGA